jgi:hypothetical protein
VQAFSASPRERICSEAGSAEALSREHPKSRAAPQRRCTAGTPRRDFKGGQRRCTGTASIPSSDADCSGNASSLLDRGKPLGTLASRAPRRSLGTRIISYANSYSQGIGDSLGTAGISEASNASPETGCAEALTLRAPRAEQLRGRRERGGQSRVRTLIAHRACLHCTSGPALQRRGAVLLAP